METLSRETILMTWQKLGSAEQRRLVAQHLRDTLYSSPLYRAKAEQHSDPMAYWMLLASSSAALIPPGWIAQLEKSYTAQKDPTPVAEE